MAASADAAEARQRARPIRIRDVAERARVSVATVSRVLNGGPNVDSELQDRVLAAVAQLGYRRNRLASNASSRPVSDTQE